MQSEAKTQKVSADQNRAEQVDAIISASISDGAGGSAGTVIVHLADAILRIKRSKESREIPLQIAAAAPELLEACKLALQEIECVAQQRLMHNPTVGVDITLGMTQAERAMYRPLQVAIAKATA